MDKHYGQLVEHIVRRKGYNLSNLAKELNVNRRTIYNWFQNKSLQSDVIYRIGFIIKHDYSKEFPEVFTTEDFSDIYGAKKFSGVVVAVDNLDINNKWKEKYISLLEKYNSTLTVMSTRPEQGLN